MSTDFRYRETYYDIDIDAVGGADCTLECNSTVFVVCVLRMRKNRSRRCQSVDCALSRRCMVLGVSEDVSATTRSGIVSSKLGTSRVRYRSYHDLRVVKKDIFFFASHGVMVVLQSYEYLVFASHVQHASSLMRYIMTTHVCLSHDIACGAFFFFSGC